MNPFDDLSQGEDEELEAQALGPTDPMKDWLARYKSQQAPVPASVPSRMPAPRTDVPRAVGSGLEKGGPIEDPETMAFLSQYGQNIIPRGGDELAKVRDAGPGPSHGLSNMDLLRQAQLPPAFDINSITADASLPPTAAPTPVPPSGKGGAGRSGAAAGTTSAAAAPPVPSGKVMDVGTGKLGRDADLKDAQNRAANVKFVNEMGKAGDIIGAGIAGGQPVDAAQKLFDSNIKDADSIVQDYQQRVANQKNDPDSPYSKAFREYAKQFGIDIRGDFTASDGEKIAPMLYKQFEHEADEKYRGNTLGLKRDELSETARHHKAMEGITRAKAGGTVSKEDNKRFDMMNKTLNAQLANSRSDFGISAKALSSIRKLEAMVGDNDLASMNHMNKQQVAEFARGLDAVISNGNPTVSGFKHLMPESAWGNTKNRIAYLTNINQGAGMGSFVKQMMETANREKKVNQQILRGAQNKVLGSYYDLKTRNPDKWSQVMRAHELPEEEIDALLSGHESSPSGAAPTEAPQEKAVGGKRYKKVPGGWEEVG